MRYLYADTSVWNRLCDQSVDPRPFSSALADRGVELALGFNVAYEIAKQFFVGGEGAKERGRELFAYMKRYLALRVPIVKENWAILVEEAMDVTGTQPMQSCFRKESDRETTIREIERLCNGDVAPGTLEFFESRKSAARRSRSSMRDNLEGHPDLKAVLDRVSEEGLPDFLGTACVGPLGRVLLLGHLHREFPGHSRSDLAHVAKRLLEFPRYRFSRTMTRADLYLNWRCVKRGSIRSDLPDDTFHAVSAAYCDVFATTEPDQANIARLANEGIRAVVCDQSGSISDRLVNEVEGPPNLS